MKRRATLKESRAEPCSRELSNQHRIEACCFVLFSTGYSGVIHSTVQLPVPSGTNVFTK